MNSFRVIDHQLLEANDIFIKIVYQHMNGKAIIWFKAKDICRVLGYSNTKQAIIVNVLPQNIEKGLNLNSDHLTYNEQNTKYINISGLFQLLCSSKLPSARNFQEWLFQEGLPHLWEAEKIHIENTLLSCQRDINNHEHTKGYVYTVTSPLLAAIKVGRWSASMDKLKCRYQTYIGNNMDLKAVFVDDCFESENAMHCRLKDHCINGELYDKNEAEKITNELSTFGCILTE